MSKFDFVVWEFNPESKACERCLSMAGTYTERPSRPHPNCNCSINPKPDICELIEASTQEWPTGEPTTEIVGYVQPGGTKTVKYGRKVKTGHRQKGSAGAEASSLTVGGEVEESKEEENYTDEEDTFAHNPSLGDGTQAIVNIYQEYTVVRIEQWQCTLHGSFAQEKIETENRLMGQEQVPV
jgi:hypothetical protein